MSTEINHRKKFIAKLHKVSAANMETAMLVDDDVSRENGIEASNMLSNMAQRMERKDKENLPAVLTLAKNATQKEVRQARQRQAVRRGIEVYLPSWHSSCKALPDIFLRTALFSSSSSIQKQNEKVLSKDSSLLISENEIGSLQDVCLIFSGYPLCQYDRQVYATCLDYYREKPLAPNKSYYNHFIQTNFYEFANRIGNTHNAKTYTAIRASLIRLGNTQLELRKNSLDISIPEIISVEFDMESTEYTKGSDSLSLSITESIAELFGVGQWTAVDNKVVNYTGLKGWVANFYATHSKAVWLPLQTLYHISGYESRFDNFKNSLIKALDSLKESPAHNTFRIENYTLTKDKSRINVVGIKKSFRQDVEAFAIDD